MRRRQLIAVAFGGSFAGCTETSAPADTDQQMSEDNTAAPPTIEATEIETTERSAGGKQPATSTYEMTESAVTITGTIPTRALCPDRVAVIETVSITEGVLNIRIRTQREQEDILCQEVLSSLTFQATIAVANIERLSEVEVSLPDERV